MSTQIGEVSINLRLSMAKFANDVRAGGTAVQQASNQMGEAVSAGTDKSREAIRLLSEDIGIRLPRGLQTFIAQLPGVSTALNSAFTGIAILAVIELIAKVVEKFQEARQRAKDLQDALANSGTAGQESIDKLNAKILDLEKQFDELTGDKLGALKLALVQIDNTRMAELTSQLKGVGKEMDDLLAKMQVSWWTNLFGQGDNKGVEMVKEQADSMLAVLNDTKASGNLTQYGEQLAGILASAKAGADDLANTSQVQRAWELVVQHVQQLQTAFQDANRAANLDKLDQTGKLAVEQVDQLTEAAKNTGTAWLEMESKVKPPSTDPTAELSKNLDDALSAIQHFGIIASGVWTDFDIAAAKSSATSRAFDNELNQLIGVVNQLDTGMKALPAFPGAQMQQAMPFVVKNMTALQQQLAAVRQGGQAADEATQEVIDAQETLHDKYSAQVQILVELQNQGRITFQQMSQGIDSAAAALDKSDKSWQKMGVSMGHDVSNAFNSIVTGTQKWSTALEDALQKMILLVAESEIMKALNDSLGNAFGGQIFGSGGIFGGRAEGGPVEANTPYWVGERRTPELFVPKVAGTIVPLSQIHSGSASGHTTNIHMEVNTPDANSFGASQGQLLSDAYRNARVAAAQNRGR